MDTNKPTNLVVQCPHCKYPILIEELNCRIFRHGVFKINGTQINPHASKELCDFYVQNDLILGCSKPFQIIQNENSINNDDTFIAVICDYI
jgi:DNA-directed RNA polymerase subunit RPC12/RpoP